MKKVLLGTSAIALAGAFASTANAAEWSVRVGGYMEQYVAYSEFDASSSGGAGTALVGVDQDGVDAKSEAEVYVIPSITLDNGLEFGANIQFEGNSAGAGNEVDESYLFIDGSFGEINIGSENSAGYKMSYIAPDVTFMGVNSGSITNWIPLLAADYGNDFYRMTLGSSTVETLGNSDLNRISYYTPRFAGFQVGVSYARDNTEQSNAALDCDVNNCDFFDVGANYVNSFGDFNVALSGRYGWVNAPTGGDPEVWAAGLNLGYAGFTIGGSYAHSDEDHGAAAGQYFDAGISYETGPWGVSFTYSRGENENNELVGSDEELEQYLVGVNYAIAQGVSLLAFGAYADFEEDFNNEEMDGWVLGTGVRIDF